MAEATKNVSYEDFILNAKKESKLYSNSTSLDDYWYAPIEARENDLINESIKRGALYLAQKVA